MFSFSLRRKSAPGSLNVRDGDPSPPKRQSGIVPSVSSKKSLSSLFSIASRDSSPRALKASDELDVLEQAQYPVYDPANPDHNPSAKRSSMMSPLKQSKRQSRSSSRSGDPAASKSFLDTLASKMRAATEFFHKSRDSSSANSDDSDPRPAPRSVSPKKSVRFRSSTYAAEEPKSSPIAVPKKSAPILPTLELPNAPFINSFIPGANDPIPTGRPPTTPCLKANEGDGYFPNPEPDTFIDFKKQMEETLPNFSKKDHDDIPFDDKVALQKCKSGSTTISATGSVSSNLKRLVSSKSDSDKTNFTSETLYEEQDLHKAEFDDECTATEANVDKIGTEVKTPTSATVHDAYQPPSAQISFAIVRPAVTPLTATKAEDTITATNEDSLWTLESRKDTKQDRDEFASESEDLDFRHSPTGSPDRTHRRRPTHEDIRQQFRSSHIRSVPGLRDASSSSAASDVDLEARIAAKHEEANDKKSLFHSAALSASPYTDPSKSLPPTIAKEASLEHAVVVPDTAVSPLNLKANISSTSPSRPRRPFRFSNSTDRAERVSPIGNTSFSWAAKKSDDKDYEHVLQTPTHTPSPVSIPLPLSIPPKKLPFRLRQPELRYTDQFGWSPFDEQLFPESLLSSPSLHFLCLTPGGFRAFWHEADLPEETAPSYDSAIVSEEQFQSMLAYARRFTQSPDILPEQDTVLAASNIMDKMFSPWAASNVNRFAALANHQKDYSGEVSTVDLSTADICSDADPPCLDHNCKMCVTRGSYESSTDRSALGSVCGYESDLEAVHSDQENIPPLGRHTPSRLPRITVPNKTPTQTGFAKNTITRSNGKRMRCSGASNTTVSTIGCMSEDETFAKGIV